MKPLYILLTFFILASCQNEKSASKKTTEPTTQKIKSKEITNSSFQTIIDEAKLNGVILIFDPQKNEFHSNDFKRADKGYLPASTFKVPNSMILMETGVVNENTLFKWDGEKRYFKMWERDFIFKEAFQKSCLPCYQEVTPSVGVKRMKDFLKKFDYGKMEVDSASMNKFWIDGNSKISARQQVNFLQKFYNSQLPISPKTEKFVKNIMVIDEKNTYKLSGKTGWAASDDFDLGWFVGYVEQGENVYFLATNVDPKEDFNMKNFLNIRLKITLDALKMSGIIIQESVN